MGVSVNLAHVWWKLLAWTAVWIPRCLESEWTQSHGHLMLIYTIVSVQQFHWIESMGKTIPKILANSKPFKILPNGTLPDPSSVFTFLYSTHKYKLRVHTYSNDERIMMNNLLSKFFLLILIFSPLEEVSLSMSHTHTHSHTCTCTLLKWGLKYIYDE